MCSGDELLFRCQETHCAKDSFQHLLFIILNITRMLGLMSPKNLISRLTSPKAPERPSGSRFLALSRSFNFRWFYRHQRKGGFVLEVQVAADCNAHALLSRSSCAVILIRFSFSVGKVDTWMLLSLSHAFNHLSHNNAEIVQSSSWGLIFCFIWLYKVVTRRINEHLRTVTDSPFTRKVKTVCSCSELARHINGGGKFANLAGKEAIRITEILSFPPVCTN